MNKKLILGLSLAFLAIAVVGTCTSWSRPSEVSAEQLQVLNRQLDGIQEQVAAVESGGIWLLLILASGILAPVILAVVLLTRAEKAALHNDEIWRVLDQHGIASNIIDTGKLLNPPAPLRRIVVGRGWIVRVVHPRDREAEKPGSGHDPTAQRREVT